MMTIEQDGTRENKMNLLGTIINQKPMLANWIGSLTAGMTVASVCGFVTPILGSLAAAVFLLIQWSKFKQQKMQEKITALKLESYEHKIHPKKSIHE